MNAHEQQSDTAELQGLAQAIFAWATKQGVPLTRVVRDYPSLGSERTWRDLREGRTESYDVETQLANYRAALATIEEIGGAVTGEPIFDDLSPVVQLRRAFLETTKCSGTNRVVIVQGASGIGKSTALRMLTGKYGQRIVTVEASDAWGDRPSALLGSLLRALGVGELPSGATARLERCQELLGVSRRCVAVDEAHHLGPHCLNTVKTLVNTTPGEWVLVAIPTLWAKLETKSYQEARQLSTNRLSERIRLELTERDIERYLARAFEAEGSPSYDQAGLKAAARLIRPPASACGNLAFVRDAARMLREMAAGAELTAQHAADAVAAAGRRR
jgi:energy-coupling factor transporter ATP-binding protein EcfA2